MKTTAKFLGLTLMGIPMLMASCGGQKEVAPELTKSGLDPQKFEAEINGKKTSLFTLTNANGMEVCITSLGGRIVSLMVPDRDGNLQDVVLGYDNVLTYANLDGKTPSDYGACIGRYANRINQGKFTLDGVEYDLPKNNFGHCLHGGPTGWQYQVYDGVYNEDSTSVTMTIISPDGDNNFPGTVTASCTYTLLEDNQILISYEATTDKPTIINMTNHSYFNLSGDPSTDCMSDILGVNAKKITPIDNTCMTDGTFEEIAAGSTFDFYTEPKPMGKQIEDDNQQLKNANGYDHNFVLDEDCASLDKPACLLYSPKTGISMQLFTTEPGVQVYTANFQDGTAIGKKGIAYPFRCAVCLEPQKYPNTPNFPEWPSCVLRPGETYNSTTVLQFGVVAE